MKNVWPTKRLGDLCAIASGGTPSKDNPRFWFGDVPFVSARDLKSDRIETAFLHISREAVEQSATKLAPVGSLLMLVRGMGLANGIQIGEVVVPVAFNQDLRAIQPRPGSVLPRFLLLGLRNSFINGENVRAFSSAAHGTLKIDADVLRQITIPVPPLAEQQRIVGVLDEAFAGLANAQANAGKNLQNARALFESHLQSVFTQRGPGWVETKLEACCEQIFAGGDVPKDRLSKERTSQYSVPIYSNGEKDEGLYGFTDLARVTKPSITVSARGTLGFTAIRTEPFLPVVRLIVLVPNEKQISLSFLYYAVVGMDFGNTGTSIPQLTVPNFKESKLHVPPLSEQRAIVERLDALSEETQRLATLYERKQAALAALKQSLLHQAFTGEL